MRSLIYFLTTISHICVFAAYAIIVCELFKNYTEMVSIVVILLGAIPVITHLIDKISEYENRYSKR